MLCVFSGHCAIVDLLIKNDADLDAVDWCRCTCAQWAHRNRHVDILRLLDRDENTVPAQQPAGAPSSFRAVSIRERDKLLWDSMAAPSIELGKGT